MSSFNIFGDFNELPPQVDYKSLKLNEHKDLKSLNNRFASYIERVRFLEQTNVLLDAQHKHLSSVYNSKLREIYDTEKKRLKNAKEMLTADIEKRKNENMVLKVNVEDMRSEYIGAVNENEELRNERNHLRADVDDFTVLRVKYERMLQTLNEDNDFDNRIHHETSKELRHRLQTGEQPLRLQMHDDKPDLKDLIRSIKDQHESSAKRTRENTQNWYNSKLNDLNYAVTRDEARLKETRNDINDYKVKMKKLQAEIDMHLTQKEYMEKQLADIEKHYNSEKQRIQAVSDKTESEFRKVKKETSEKMKEHQELLEIKLHLDFEINTYRKLLESEENRFHVRGSDYELDTITKSMFRTCTM